eukprot:SAG11_NODE_8314_length_1030_cov_1.659506_1_plen_131_part_10
MHSIVSSVTQSVWHHGSEQCGSGTATVPARTLAVDMHMPLSHSRRPRPDGVELNGAMMAFVNLHMAMYEPAPHAMSALHLLLMLNTVALPAHAQCEPVYFDAGLSKAVADEIVSSAATLGEPQLKPLRRGT